MSLFPCRCNCCKNKEMQYDHASIQHAIDKALKEKSTENKKGLTVKITMTNNLYSQSWSAEHFFEGGGYFDQLKQSFSDALELHELRLEKRDRERKV